MKKWMFSAAALALMSATATHAESLTELSSLNAPQAFVKSDANYVEPYMVPTQRLTVVGEKLTGFNSTAMTRVTKAFKLIEQVVNSEEFKERILNFKNTKGVRAFASNNGMTNEQIYETFMAGRETLLQDTPGEMNFYLRVYNAWWSRVIGYTSADTNTISMNWKFHKNYTAANMTGNLVHEWVHKIGFDHRSAGEHDSAPYAIGYIVEEMARKLSK
jgi:hypothetical protein